MTAKTFHRNITGVIAAAVGMLTWGVASSGDLNLTRQAYEDEMNRCINLLRPLMPVNTNSKIIYDVQGIDLRGPWYLFDISVSIEDQNGVELVDGYKFGCKSNRWKDSSELQSRRNTQQLPEKMELMASK